MKKVYETTVEATGGRDGKVKSKDGAFTASLSMPKELGGAGTPGATNPEQLFAAGYGACFDSAIRFVARSKKIAMTESTIHTTIQLFAKPEGGFKLGAQLDVSLPGLEREVAQSLVDAAHQVCPYSNATRGNIDVQINLI